MAKHFGVRYMRVRFYVGAFALGKLCVPQP